MNNVATNGPCHEGEDVAIVHPCNRIGCEISVPGDKSISHRLAMLGALSAGETFLTGFLESGDCLSTLCCLEMLGAKIDCEGSNVRISGTGGEFTQPAQPLDFGNSGTGLRLLSGLLAGQRIVADLTGDDSLRSRPMRRIQEPLEQMGARVELLGKDGCAPIRIHGSDLIQIEYPLPVASAQVKSCILFAGLYAKGETSVVEPKPTRDHTERMLAGAGIPIRVDGLRITVRGGKRGTPVAEGRSWRIPGDFSSAAYWIVAAAAGEGNECVIRDVGLNPRRTALLRVLERMGADISVEVDEDTQDVWEARGTVRVHGRKLRGTRVAGAEIPNLIDELPLIAVAGALGSGETEIRQAAELRVKESDRISATAAGLNALGVDVDEYDDGWLVRGSEGLSGGVEIDSRGDHRIAMAMAVLGLFAQRPIRILGSSCVESSYPGFWRDFQKVAGQDE